MGETGEDTTIEFVSEGRWMYPIDFHIDHDRRRNYYTVGTYANEFKTVAEARAFARLMLSLGVSK